MKKNQEIYRKELGEISKNIKRDIISIVQDFGEVGTPENDELPHFIVTVPKDIASKSDKVEWKDQSGVVHRSEIKDVKCYSSYENFSIPEVVVVTNETDPDTDEYIELDLETEIDIWSMVSVYETLCEIFENKHTANGEL